MSTKLRRWGPILTSIAFLLMISTGAGAAITPESDVLLPWFEVDLANPDAGVATTFSIVNASADSVRTRLTMYTNWGIPVLEVPLTFSRAEAKTIDLRAWIARGALPDRTLPPAELANLQAALTGKPLPKDGLYYGTAAEGGAAVGYLIIQTLDERPDTLWGDTYTADAATNQLGAETLTALTHGLAADCNRHGIRFVNDGKLYEGEELVIWSGRRFQPSATPVPAGAKMNATISVYDQAGRHIQDCHRELIAVEALKVCQLDVAPPIGWLDIATEEPSFILQHLHTTTNATAEIHSYCLNANLKLAGPSIALEKTIRGDDADQPRRVWINVGEDVEFEYHVTNNGTVSLHAVSVTDDTGLDVSCPKGVLAAGESMTCKAHAIAAGCTNLNIGTAAGTSPEGVRVSASDPAYYFGMYAPELTVETLVNGEPADDPPGPYLDAGDPLYWTFIVTNSGNAPVSGISVVRANGDAAQCPKGELEPGQSMTCTAESLAAEGAQHEVGTAKGNDACNSPVVATDPANYFGRRNAPAIDLRKYVNESDANVPPGPAIATGSTITWQYVVTNTGNVPLHAIFVTDDAGITPVCPQTSLEPGQSMTCTSSSVALPCQQSNIGTARGTTGGTTSVTTETYSTVSAQDPAHYFGEPAAAIALELRVNGDPADEPSGPWIDEGTSLAFTYEVTNSGNVELTNIVAGDGHGRSPACPKTSLLPGESMTCTATGTALAGNQEIPGEVSARPLCGEPVQASDPAYYRGKSETPGIAVVKMTNGVHAESAPGPTLTPGDAVQWTYVVTNTGTVSLSSITVTDSREASVTCPKTSLEAGESMTCTASGTAQACQYSNTAVVEGHSPAGKTVSASDDSFYLGEHHEAISMVKLIDGLVILQPPGPTIMAGATIYWSFKVTNSGDVSLSGVTVTDSQAGTVTCPKSSLAPGEMMTCTASSPALRGKQQNSAEVTANPACGAAVSATGTSYYWGTLPDIGMEKRVNGEDADDANSALQVPVGSSVLWTFVVTNTGDITLLDIAVSDDPALTITCPRTGLAPTESMTCTASAGVGEGGLNCNTATASARTPQNRIMQATDSACYVGQYGARTMR